MKSNALHFLLSSNFRDILGYSLAFVFFFYLVVFAFVAPSPALIGAVSFEIVVYFLFLGYRIRRRKDKSVSARQSINAGLILTTPGCQRLSSAIFALVALGGSFFLLSSLIDAFSFGLAAAGRYDAAAKIYSRFPVSTLAGVSPAYTMELLSGAKMKAGHYADVERMYKALYNVRVEHYGARSERICDLYADFGDLAEKRGDAQKAELFYVRAINLSKEIKVPQGCGKYLTRLGQLQAEHGRYDEALKTLAEARSMRSRIFGENSQKVAETMLVIARVQLKMGHAQYAEWLTAQARMILRALPKTEVNTALYSAFVSLFLFAAVFLSTEKSGWLTRFVIARLEMALSDKRVSSDQKAKMNTHLQVLKEYVAGSKTKGKEISNDLEAANLCLLLSLTSQDLR